MMPWRRDLEGTVAIVTGAGRGIGRATAAMMVQRGIRVVLASRSEDELRAVASQLAEGPGEVLVVPTDIRREEQIDALMDRSLDAFGRVDSLVNNAGVGLWCPVEDCRIEDWDRLMAVNLRGAFLCSKAVIKQMRAQGGGDIVFVSSGAGRRGLKNRAAYSATKFGMIGFSEALAQEVSAFNIRVAVLLPGDVDTSFTKDYPPEGKEIHKNVPLRPEDVAQAILGVLEMPAGARISEISLRPI